MFVSLFGWRRTYQQQHDLREALDLLLKGGDARVALLVVAILGQSRHRGEVSQRCSGTLLPHEKRKNPGVRSSQARS